MRVCSTRAMHPELADQLGAEALRKKVERFFLIQVISYDWNCPQYITPRFTAAQVENFTAPLKARIAELEAKLAARGTPMVASQPMISTYKSPSNHHPLTK